MTGNGTLAQGGFFITAKGEQKMDYKYMIGIRVFDEDYISDGNGENKHCFLEDGVGRYKKELHEVAHTMLQCVIDGYIVERIENRKVDGNQMIIVKISEVQS